MRYVCRFPFYDPVHAVEALLLVYLLQAYDYVPDDPLVCLSLAIASVGRAMQRQSDNRHHLITQVCTSAFRARDRD